MNREGQTGRDVMGDDSTTLAAPGEAPPAAPNEHRDLLRCSPLDVTLPRLRAHALLIAALARLATVYFPRVLLGPSPNRA